MTSTSSIPTFAVRHVQIARALFAALAAIMITFSPDHSAVVGMAVFSGFAIATGIVHFAAVWLVYPAGARWPSVALGLVTVVAGMVGGVGPTRTPTGFFATVVVWALLSGLIEGIAGIRGLRSGGPRKQIAPGVDDRRPEAPVAPRSESRDALVVGVVGLLLGIGLLCIPTGYALNYTIEEAHQSFTLTGTTIGVGIFGAYAAIVAVYLGIAGFSPRPVQAETAAAEQKDLA